MSCTQPARHGGVTSALLALVLLVLVAVAAIFLIPGLKDRLFGSVSETPTPSPSPVTPLAPAAATKVGTVTAVRAKEGMPTFCLVASSSPLPAMGAILQINRAGKAYATLLLESVAGDQLTCRVTTWATGTQELAVGDVVEKP